MMDDGWWMMDDGWLIYSNPLPSPPCSMPSLRLVYDDNKMVHTAAIDNLFYKTLTFGSGMMDDG